MKCCLFGAADLDPGAFFDCLDVRRCLVQTAAGAGIQPGETAVQAIDAQLIPAQEFQVTSVISNSPREDGFKFRVIVTT